MNLTKDTQKTQRKLSGHPSPRTLGMTALIP